MLRRFCLALSCVAALAGPVFATDTPVTVPSLGIDWSGTVTTLTTTVGTVIVAALGLWAAIIIVRVAKRFIGQSLGGR